MPFIRKHLLLFAGAGLVMILVAVVLVLRQIGFAYGQGLKIFEGRESHEPAALAKNARIRKITVKKSDTGECIEVTPDGAVRVYKTCGGDLEDAHRTSDTRTVQRLFTLVTETGSKTYVPGSTEVMVELEDGSVVTVYIPPGGDAGGGGGGSGSGGGSDIDNIIDEIKGDGPTPTAPPGATGTPLVTPTFAPTMPAGPTPTPNPFATPTPTPEPEKPFTCDFYDTGGSQAKPYRVSNVVCSTQPQPGH